MSKGMYQALRFAITAAMLVNLPTNAVSAAQPPLRGPIGPNSSPPNPPSSASDVPSDSSAINNEDVVELEPLKLQALISVSKTLDPFQLDAASNRTVTLREMLQTAMNKNLDIRIRQYDVKSKNWSVISSYGKFLPNVNLSYRWQYLKGRPNIPFTGGSDSIKFQTPFIITGAGFTQYVYRGGKVFNTALQNRSYLRASRYQEKANLSDVLFDTSKRYFDLVLNEAILQIRIKAVETSEAQLQLNKNLLEGGKATRLDVLQAQTQLSSDRQRLIDQQIDRRNSSIALSEILDLDQGVDLLPQVKTIERRRLLAPEIQPSALLKAAVDNRPELKQYKELWLAARRSAKIAAAPLQPSVQMFGNIYGIGETLSDSSRVTLAPVTLGTASTTTSVGPKRLSRQIGPLYTLGYQVNWAFEGLGISDLGNIESAKYQSRQSMLELNKQLNMVTSQVRQSYLKTLSADRKIEETKAKLESASEELRLAQMRLQYGVGKNIDVLKAQEDLTSARIENVQALITFNVAQAQLLRDLGIISVDRLSSSIPRGLN